MPVLAEPRAFNDLIELMCQVVKDVQFDRILGIESRGFLLGPSIAQKLNIPFVPIRKKGKLPGQLYSMQYDLEYGHDTLEVQKYALPRATKCVLVDDLIASGGSLEASKKLVEMSGSTVVASIVVIELVSLDGKKKLGGTPVHSLFKY